MIINKDLIVEFKKIFEGIELKARQTSYKMIISKQVEDRDGEIIILNGINLKKYLKNPIVLLDHSYKVENIVGKTTNLYIEGDSLIADFVFVDTENGIMAEKLYNAGVLKASSIGFIAKKRNKDNFSIIDETELLEWSLVAVPCNAEALSLDAKDYEEAIQKGFIKKDIEEIEDINIIEVGEDEDEEINELQEIKEELKTIKELLKKLADDKADNEELKKQEQLALEKKQTLQAIDSAVGEALKNLKLLK